MPIVKRDGRAFSDLSLHWFYEFGDSARFVDLAMALPEERGALLESESL